MRKFAIDKTCDRVDCGNHSVHEQGAYYLVQDVDQRIATLENELQSCAFALAKIKETIHKWDGTIDIAIEGAQKALALSSTG